jgi:hypothetical protein
MALHICRQPIHRWYTRTRHAMAQEISRWPDKADACYSSQSIPSEIYGGKSGAGVGVSSSTSVSPVIIILPALHTHSYILTIHSTALTIDSIIKYQAVKEFGLSYTNYVLGKTFSTCIQMLSYLLSSYS